MNPKPFTVSLMSLLVAVACSPKEEQKTEKKPNPAASICRHANVPNQLHDDLQAAILEETKKFTQTDSHQLVDIDKISAAANQLKLNINGIQDKEGQCRGKISILIPQNIQKIAQTHAQLVGIKHYDTIIEERMGSANFQFNGSTLTLPINFTVSGDPISVKQSDEAFQTAAMALSTALLPYGVKDNVQVAGRTMTPEMALQVMKMNGGKLPAAPAPRPAEPEKTADNTSEPTSQPTKPTPEKDNRDNREKTKPTPPKTTPAPVSKITESPEQKALREARAAEAAAKLAAEKAAQRAAKAKAAREAREAAEAAKLAAAKAKTKAENNNGNNQSAANNNNNIDKNIDKDKTPSLTPQNPSSGSLTPKRPMEDHESNSGSLTPNVTPEAPKPKSRVSDAELEKVRKAHRQADQDIKSSWKKINPDIRQKLVDEQKSWEKQRNQRCRQAAAAGGDESESNKLYMQCDTRMTKERVKNLEGYSIQ